MTRTSQRPEDNPNDTVKQGALRAKVEQMMSSGRIRNAEGERVAALPDTIREDALAAALRAQISDEAVLVLLEDGTVEWEQPDGTRPADHRTPMERDFPHICTWVRHQTVSVDLLRADLVKALALLDDTK